MGDDLYARDWMAMLVVRDWRTRLISEGSCDEDLLSFKTEQNPRIDFLLLDLDTLRDRPELLKSINRKLEQDRPFRIICVSSKAEPRVFKGLDPANFAGYLLKNEISTSLTWAVTFASEGNFVLTPGAQQCAFDIGYQLPAKYMVLEAHPIPGLTARQSEISRLAIIFSLGRRDLADELKVSDQWSYGMVSELYEDLGLKELFSSNNDLYSYLNEDTMIKEHLTEILAELGDSKKAKDLETLAFHLITLPVIDTYQR